MIDRKVKKTAEYGGLCYFVKTATIEVRWMEWWDSEKKWREYELVRALRGKTHEIEIAFLHSAYGFWL